MRTTEGKQMYILILFMAVFMAGFFMGGVMIEPELQIETVEVTPECPKKSCPVVVKCDLNDLAGKCVEYLQNAETIKGAIK